MLTEHRRALRHLLGGAVEVTDLESERQIVTLARNLSLFGLFCDNRHSFRCRNEGQIADHTPRCDIRNPCRVAYASASEGMGIAFGEIEDRDRAILDAWLGEKQP